MKKTFPLAVAGKNPERLLDATRHEIHKYLKRERRRALPEGVDFWDFDCRFGPDADAAAPAHVSELMGLIGAIAATGAPSFYVEILARHGVRPPRPAVANPE